MYGTQPTRKNKLQPYWIGPFRVTEIVARNVYEVKDLTGKTRVVHASRLWFYNTSNYVPEAYVEKIFRQHWSGLDLDSITELGQDEHGNLNVLIRWYELPDDEPAELTIAQMLDGGQLMLDRYLEDILSDVRPDLYEIFKQKVQAYQKRLQDTQVISVHEHSTNEGYWNRTLDDFRPL